jgi:phosphoadenosine phosphosulfate reductase
VRAAPPDLESLSAQEVLAHVVDEFHPRLYVACSFQKEASVILDMLLAIEPAARVFTLDTGVLFPETYALWRALEAKYGIEIRAVRPEQTIDAQALAHGPRLWERDADRCCELRKVQPLRAALAPFDAWITAIRRDQTPERAHARVVEPDPKFGLAKINPLVGWAHHDVWGHIYAHDVPYNPLHERGYPSIGCQPCTSAVAAGEDPRAGRWRGAAKTECGLHTSPSKERQAP